MFTPEIFNIYGPFSINSYGLFIVIGLIAFIFFVLKDPKRSPLFSKEQFLDILAFSILVGVIGGRALYLIMDWQSIHSILDVISVWDGGLSLLGTIISLLIFLPWYLQRLKIKIIPFFDLVAIYVPLLQSISRIGCFIAGCCYGRETVLPWAVTYIHPKSLAPLCLKLHPTQLYSATGLLIIFLLMYFIFQYKFKKPGQLICLYLMFASAERFLVDFFRADQEFLSFHHIFSLHQLIALCIFIPSLIIFLYSLSRNNK